MLREWSTVQIVCNLPPTEDRKGCENILGSIKPRMPSMTALNLYGTNHRPNGRDRRSRAVYEVDAKPGSVRIHEHRWTCLACGAVWIQTAERLESIYREADRIGKRVLVAGVDFVDR